MSGPAPFRLALSADAHPRGEPAPRRFPNPTPFSSVLHKRESWRSFPRRASRATAERELPRARSKGKGEYERRSLTLLSLPELHALIFPRLFLFSLRVHDAPGGDGDPL